jgi:hypothetical protein
MEERMMRLTILGPAVVLSFGGPAVAHHVLSSPSYAAMSTYCANPEPGNPLTEKFDCLTWNDWLTGGGWDSRSKNVRLHNHRIHHRERGF